MSDVIDSQEELVCVPLGGARYLWIQYGIVPAPIMAVNMVKHVGLPDLPTNLLRKARKMAWSDCSHFEAAQELDGCDRLLVAG